MDSLPVIFDISSDDDELCRGEPEGDDYDWLSQVLKSVDAPPPPPEDDSDDVVVVSEANQWKRARLAKVFDEDCVILDGDPEKSDGAVNGNENGNEEVLIVGEKGQVACRDFPHSRQHCAKFPFNSTPHEKHCSLCHCYVCDCIAPCKYWGKGGAEYDHCHATEKEGKWKLQRENSKKRKMAPPSVPKLSYASQSVSLPNLNQVSQKNQVRRFHQVTPPGSIQPTQPGSVIRPAFNPVMQNQVSRPSVILQCTSSAFNPVVQNQGSRPNVLFSCTSAASNPVTKVSRPNMTPSNPVMQNQPSRPNVILPCTSSASNPATQVSGPNRVLPQTFSGSNPATQNQVSRPIPNVTFPFTSSPSSPFIQDQACKPPGMFIQSQGCWPAAVHACTHGRGYTGLPGFPRIRIQQQHKLAARRPDCPGNNDFKCKEGDTGTGNPGTIHYGSPHSINHARALQQPGVSNVLSTQTMLYGRSWSVSTSPPRPGSCQSQNYSQPSTGNMFLNPAVPSQPQTQNQPLSHPSASQNGIDQQSPVPSQPQIKSQPLAHPNPGQTIYQSQNGLHQQPPVPSQPQIQSQPLSLSNASQNGLYQQPQIQSQPISHPNPSQIIYHSQNGLYQQPQIQSQPISHPNPSQIIYHGQNGLHQQQPPVPSQPQIQSQPLSHSHASQNGLHTQMQVKMASQPQPQSQPLSNPNASQNGFHQQPPVLSQPQVQTQPISHSNASQNGLHQQPPVPSQPQIQSQPISHPNPSQTIYQSQNSLHKQPQIQSQHISHPNASQPIYNSQNGTNQHPPVVENEPNPPLPASSNQNSPSFDIDKWLLDNEPQHAAPLDSGTLYFEWLWGNEYIGN